MNKAHTKYPRILAIAIGTRGLGYVVFDGQDVIVDLGVKTVKAKNSGQRLAKVNEMIAHHQPEVVVLEKFSVDGSRRPTHTRALGRKIVTHCGRQNLRVKLFSRMQVMRTFFAHGEGNKHAIAEILGNRFPDELGFRLPPKRRPWMSEDYRMGIFQALALAMCLRLEEQRRIIAGLGPD